MPSTSRGCPFPSIATRRATSSTGSTWACTPIGAPSSTPSTPFPIRRWSARRTSSSFVSSSTAYRSASSRRATPPSAWTRKRTSRQSPRSSHPAPREPIRPRGGTVGRSRPHHGRSDLRQCRPARYPVHRPPDPRRPRAVRGRGRLLHLRVLHRPLAHVPPRGLDGGPLGRAAEHGAGPGPDRGRTGGGRRLPCLPPHGRLHGRGRRGL